jgi:hypothetical protein
VADASTRERIAMRLATLAHAPQPVRTGILRLVATAMVGIACLAGGAAVATWHAQGRAAAAAAAVVRGTAAAAADMAPEVAQTRLQAELTRARLALAQSESARAALQASADAAAADLTRLETEMRFLRAQRAAVR